MTFFMTTFGLSLSGLKFVQVLNYKTAFWCWIQSAYIFSVYNSAFIFVCIQIQNSILFQIIIPYYPNVWVTYIHTQKNILNIYCLFCSADINILLSTVSISISFVSIFFLSVFLVLCHSLLHKPFLFYFFLVSDSMVIIFCACPLV